MYLQQAVDFSASENIFPAATKKTVLRDSAYNR